MSTGMCSMLISFHYLSVILDPFDTCPKRSCSLSARSALTPSTAKTLIDNNFEVFVERDPQRIFDDAEFEASAGLLFLSQTQLRAIS